MFKKEYTLHRIRDRITIREGEDFIEMKVDSDANSLMHRIRKAQETLSAVKGDSTDEEREKAAADLSEAIFGKEQTEKLAAFYGYDYNCVVTICGMYFADPKHGLAKKITKAQKRR